VCAFAASRTQRTPSKQTDQPKIRTSLNAAPAPLALTQTPRPVSPTEVSNYAHTLPEELGILKVRISSAIYLYFSNGTFAQKKLIVPVRAPLSARVFVLTN